MNEFFEKVLRALDNYGLALVMLALFLFVLTSEAKAEGPTPVTIAPNEVVMLHADQGATVLTKAMIVNGEKYLICVGHSSEFPVVQCLLPKKIIGEEGKTQEWSGVWEKTMVMLGEVTS